MQIILNKNLPVNLREEILFMTSSKVLEDSEIFVEDFSVSLSEASISENTSLK